MTHVHSVPADTRPDPCETISRHAAPALRPYVLGFSGFRADAPVSHRVLPLNLTTAIVDLTGGARVVTGPRATPAIAAETWRTGVTIGFTPLGVRTLLGVSAPELVGRTVPLGDLLTDLLTEHELVERLAAAPTWSGRFDVLDLVLRKRLVPAKVDPFVTAAWWRIQGDGVRVADVAEHFNVSRRHLELKFHREIGLTPGTVGRIARFQRAIGMLTQRRASLPETAVRCGYSDQPHFTREIRAMSGLTPTELFAFLQYRDLARP